MSKCFHSSASRGWRARLLVCSFSSWLGMAIIGCQAEVAPGPPGGSGAAANAGPGATGATDVGSTGVSGNATTDGSATGSGAGGSGAGGSGTTGSQVCTGEPGGLLAAKRVVRLTLDQVNKSIRELVGPEVADQLKSQYELENPETREFPAHLGEGHLVTDALWSKTDSMAQLAGQYVHDNFATVTGCAGGDFACASSYVTSFTSRAFRRPLDEREQSRIQQVVTEAQSIGATAEEAAEHGVYAALSAPQFLYRTELGTTLAAEELLGPYELASQLSYFITGGPPDEPLLADAAAQALNSQDALRQHAERLLATEAARENLQTLVLAYFGIPKVYSVVITAPGFNQGVANSMVRAGQLFLNNTLWGGAPVNDLLVSQTAWVNDQLAPLYGVAPPASVDADGFGPVALAADRAGILTNVGYLASSSRPDVPSVVARGVKIVDDILCLKREPFPEDIGDEIDRVSMMLEGQSERQKMEYRLNTVPCGGCHVQTDPYGMSLFSYDEIGQYRTLDPEGRQIDASVTLPPYLGSVTATSAAEVARIVAESNNFMACMAGNLMEDAIGEGTVFATDCAAQSVVNELVARGSATFPDLVREVAASRTLAFRRGGN